MTFLAPLALLGTLLLAIPIIVHLFKPRRVRQTPFSSLRWLELSQQRLARHIKWHQVLLFVMRAAFILLLVLALARPVLNLSRSDAPADRIVIVDAGRTMAIGNAISGDPHSPRPAERSSMHRARAAAEQILSSSGPGDRSALLIAGPAPRLAADLHHDTQPALAALRDIHPGRSSSDLAAAVDLARPILQREPRDGPIELFLITDNQQSAWSQDKVDRFMQARRADGRAVHVHLVDVAARRPHNAWIAEARLLPPDDPAGPEGRGSERRIIRAHLGFAGDESQQRTLILSGIDSAQEITQQVTLHPGHRLRVDLEIPAHVDLTGQAATLRLDPPDDLPDDDAYHLLLDAAGGVRVLLVEEPAASPRITPGGRRPTVHLRTALQALAAAQPGSIDLVRRDANAVSPADVREADLILLAGISRLSEAALLAIEQRVQGGAGLGIFLGPTVDRDFYNSNLYRPLQPELGLLPIPLEPPIDVAAAGGRLAALRQIDWTDSLLAPLMDPVQNDLAQARFRAYFPIQFDEDRLRAIAWIEDQAPAILTWNHSAGRVALLNFGPDDLWSSLPRQQSFVPLVDRLVWHLASGQRQRTFIAGETVVLSLPGVQPGAQVTLTSPSGRSSLHRALDGGSGRGMIHLPDLEEPGIYRINDHSMGSGAGEGLRSGRTGSGNSADLTTEPPTLNPPNPPNPPNRSWTFILQPRRSDSYLTPMDVEILAGWWGGAGFTVHNGAELATLPARPGRLALWPWLIALACITLLAEMYLVHRLCPKMNPPVVSGSTISRRGFLKPRQLSPTSN